MSPAFVGAATEFYPMNPRDLDHVAALESSIQTFPWSIGNFSDSLQAGHSCWVMRHGGDLAGFSVVMPVVDEAHLLNIGVASALQGRGLGARLLQEAMRVAALNGCHSMLLEVRPSNERAVAIYRQLGFIEIGQRRGYYPALNGREDALVFRKELT